MQTPTDSAARRPGRATFRSLESYNYRVWAGGALVSNVGTWMQRTAQDWLVLTELTNRSAASVGIVMALQFGPQLLFLPWTGLASDYFDRRRLIMATQAAMGVSALVLGALTVTGLVQLWHVYIFAFLFGTVTAFDSPARQTFVSDLVGDNELANAVALNSTSFNAARMIGPAVCGLCIAAWGTGWAFLINGASYFAVLLSLTFLRRDELFASRRVTKIRGSLVEGFRYVRQRPDLRAILLMMGLIGTFGLNFPIFISTMSVKVFHAGAGRFGLLTSIMAIGTISGAILAAGRERPRFDLMVAGAAIFFVGFTLAALAPGYWWFAATLVIVGIASLTLTNSSSSLAQLSTEPQMRGRVMALRLAILTGGTPIGAPLVGWVADRFGPRFALGIAAAAGFAAALVGLRYLIRHRDLRLWREGWHLRFSLDGDAPMWAAGARAPISVPIGEPAEDIEPTR